MYREPSGLLKYEPAVRARGGAEVEGVDGARSRGWPTIRQSSPHNRGSTRQAESAGAAAHPRAQGTGCGPARVPALAGRPTRRHGSRSGSCRGRCSPCTPARPRGRVREAPGTRCSKEWRLVDQSSSRHCSARVPATRQVPCTRLSACRQGKARRGGAPVAVATRVAVTRCDRCLCCRRPADEVIIFTGGEAPGRGVGPANAQQMSCANVSLQVVPQKQRRASAGSGRSSSQGRLTGCRSRAAQRARPPRCCWRAAAPGRLSSRQRRMSR